MKPWPTDPEAHDGTCDEGKRKPIISHLSPAPRRAAAQAAEEEEGRGQQRRRAASQSVPVGAPAHIEPELRRGRGRDRRGANRRGRLRDTPQYDVGGPSRQVLDGAPTHRVRGCEEERHAELPPGSLGAVEADVPARGRVAARRDGVPGLDAAAGEGGAPPPRGSPRRVVPQSGHAAGPDHIRRVCARRRRCREAEVPGVQDWHHATERGSLGVARARTEPDAWREDGADGRADHEFGRGRQPEALRAGAGRELLVELSLGNGGSERSADHRAGTELNRGHRRDVSVHTPRQVDRPTDDDDTQAPSDRGRRTGRDDVEHAAGDEICEAESVRGAVRRPDLGAAGQGGQAPQDRAGLLRSDDVPDVDEDHVLTASRTFTSLFLFSALRFPINYLGKLIGKAAQGLQACHRFSLFFDREAVVEDNSGGVKTNGVGADDGTRTPNSSSDDADTPVSDGTAAEPDEAPLIDVSTNFTVGDPLTSGMSFKVSGIEMQVRPGELHCIVGPVGAGKSTIVRGLIGELPPDLSEPNSRFHVGGSVSFASQVPFVLNATVRDNILFGDPLDAERYARVLDATCLASDVASFKHGDRTEIGERGVTLSGGQKARLSLARAAYSRSDVVVLDDVLSALDAGTSRAVFERLFRPVGTGRDGLFSDRAVVLVTHASHFLNRVDEIVIVAAGRCVFSGSWRDLEDCRPEDRFEADAVDAIRNSVQEEHSGDDGGDGDSAKKEESGVGNSKTEKSEDGGNEGRIMTIEERQFGLSQASTWLSWCKYSGGFGFILVVLISMVLDRGMYVMTEIWLALWTDGATEPVTFLGREYPSQTDGLGAQRAYVKTYTGILLLGCVFTLFRTNWLIQGGARCANRIFKAMLNKTVLAPMSFFDTTPLGRLMNRKSATDLQRLDATSRSPVQAQLSEAVDGSSTMRVFGKSAHFSAVFRSALDLNSGILMNFQSSQRWLAVRIQLLGSLAVLFSVSFVVSFNDVLDLDPGIAAILIIWSANLTISLSFFVLGFSEAEASMTSLERMSAMTRIQQEEDDTKQHEVVDKSWPRNGGLVFDKVGLRYRPGLPLSLNGLSFQLKSGIRCGVVGRTGAGKSTLAAALFRLVELEQGMIMFDGKDISKLALSDVRGRPGGMLMIPQDPVLFPGTLKECLDPFGDYTDEQVVEALRSVRGASRGLNDINATVEEGGRNFSVGERQLICLGRALLAKAKLLFLDEATASVDSETDALIQKMLRTRFEGTTLITIAHRLNTIMDYDVVLVMDQGRCAEFGSPAELLENEVGIFTSLVDATGKESSQTLRRIAFNQASR
ncbi:hypothetical protein THAOC_34035 [Thalassiosira oceanica]|uniref:ABC transporter domain-containing protein n=1 Tax=Thalassiosira oceanica TaxID=159749 RepID=K0R470_THAOC|nr:hypothetical protein THAOC_34035 [Thalassiosira oceanica]|eukprot:EJK47265.1 hypothetical protein THAOC_34035 [Thalassiosira oceanica]